MTAAFIILIFISAGFWTFVSYQKKHFSCESEVTLIEGEAVYNVIMDYTFNDGAGSFHSVGHLQVEGKSVNISKTLSFTYIQEDNNIVMTSEDNHVSAKTLGTQMPYIPDFFSYSGRGMSMKVIKENDAGYLFIHNNAPFFYCTRTR